MSRSPASLERLIGAWSRPRALRRSAMEPLFPAAQVLAPLPNERREDGQAEQQPVQGTGGEAQRLLEIDEQHHAQPGGLVPGLVLVGIVEDECLTLLPVAPLGPDADRESLARLGDDQAEMQAQH